MNFYTVVDTIINLIILWISLDLLHQLQYCARAQNFEYYPPTDTGIADIRFQLPDDKWVYVECTKLGKSKKEQVFSKVSTELKQVIFSEQIRKQKWCGVRVELNKKISNRATMLSRARLTH